MTGSRPGRLLPRYLMLAAADLSAKAMAFTVSIAVIRRFGPEGFGDISFAASVVVYALMLGTCGMDVFAVRSVARSPAGLGRLASTVVLLRLLLGTLAYALLLGLTLLLSPLSGVVTLLGLFGLSLFTGAVTLSWVPEGLQKTHVLALVNLGTQSLWLGLVLGALALGWGLWAVPAAQAVAEGLVAAGLLGWVLAAVGRPRLPLPWRQWGSLLGQSAPIGGGRVMRAIALGSDLVLLGFLVGREELGWYAGAAKLFLLGVSLGAVYFVILFPRLASRAASPGPALHQELQASLRRVLAMSVPAAAVLALFADPLLRVVFGPSFGTASLSFQVLLLALIANLVSSHFRSALVAQGRQRLDLGVTSAGAAAHVAFKLLLIPLLGIGGAALGTLLGEAMILLLAWLVARPACEASLYQPVGGAPARAEDPQPDPVGV